MPLFESLSAETFQYFCIVGHLLELCAITESSHFQKRMSTLWCAVFSTNSESVGAVIQAALTSQGFNKSTFEKSNFGFQYEARRHSDPLTRNGTIVSHYFVFVLLSQILMMWVEKKPNALVGTKLVVMHVFCPASTYMNTRFGFRLVIKYLEHIGYPFLPL